MSSQAERQAVSEIISLAMTNQHLFHINVSFASHLEILTADVEYRTEHMRNIYRRKAFSGYAYLNRVNSLEKLNALKGELQELVEKIKQI